MGLRLLAKNRHEKLFIKTIGPNPDTTREARHAYKFLSELSAGECIKRMPKPEHWYLVRATDVSY